MADQNDLFARLEELESAVAHQDLAIADLNRMVTGQWRLIETLQRRLEQLSEALDEAVASTGEADPNKRPPHW